VARTALLVGCGAMSGAWVDAARRLGDVAIVGLVDIDAARARALAEAKGLDVATGADLGAALASLRPDLVFDVTVPTARESVGTAALDAGCHVVSEKPMATSMAEARTLIERAEAAGRIFAVIQNRRYVAGVRRIRAFLRSGAIGEVTSLHCAFFLAPHFGGFREEMAHVLLLDMAIHTFDAARFMAGRNARTVFCRETNPAGSWYREGASAFAVFTLDDDVNFTYAGSWCAPGVRTSWEGEWRIVGTRGSLVWDGADRIRAEVEGDPREGLFDTPSAVAVPDEVDPVETERHFSVLHAVMRALERGARPETDARDNINSLAMVLAAIESAQTGRVAKVDNGGGP